MNPSLGLVSRTGARKTAINGPICGIYIFCLARPWKRLFLSKKVVSTTEVSSQTRQNKPNLANFREMRDVRVLSQAGEK